MVDQDIQVQDIVALRRAGPLAEVRPDIQARLEDLGHFEATLLLADLADRDRHRGLAGCTQEAGLVDKFHILAVRPVVEWGYLMAVEETVSCCIRNLASEQVARVSQLLGTRKDNS
jgi:hypothetical protein